jgi:hypothetical protein
MGPWLAALLAATLNLTPAVVEKDGVRVEVSIQAHIYTWTVTNLDAPPIMSFQFEHAHTYNPHAPNDWELEDVEGRIRAWTDNPRRAIHRGESETFDLRVTSSGAMLGTVPAAVGFGPDRDPIVFEEVWGPVEKTPAIGALVAVVVAIIALAHVMLLARRARRKDAAAPSGA